MTLAQKLEELANANADGLLRFAAMYFFPVGADTLTSRIPPRSDDEYRVLRQNLFERFGSVAAQIPVEQSPITMLSPSSRQSINTISNGMFMESIRSTGVYQRLILITQQGPRVFRKGIPTSPCQTAEGQYGLLLHAAHRCKLQSLL